MTAIATRPVELRADEVRRATDPASLGITTTAALAAPDGIAGQERALEAIEFALSIGDQQYNLYVSGEPGTGRSTAVARAVERAAQARPAASDWCYAYHFERPGELLALEFPAGVAPDFAHSLDACVIECRRALRRAFGAETYRQQRAALLKDLNAQREQMLDSLQREALAHGFMLQATPTGLATIPLKHLDAHDALTGNAGAAPAPGLEPMTPFEFEALPAAERQRLSAESDLVQEVVARAVPQLRALEEEARVRLRELDTQIAQQVVDAQTADLIARWGHLERVATFLQHVAADIVAHADVLRALPTQEIRGERRRDSTAELAEAEPVAPDALLDLDGDLSERPDVAILLRRYRVNVLVTGQEQRTAAVVQEINPSYANLVGRIEFGLREGLPFTDHLLLKPGAFHRANGGYLILQARDLFSRPRAWEAVKRALRFGVISMEGEDEAGIVPASASLRPQPIPVRVKVILIGDPATYALLLTLDPEFPALFKVRADFAGAMPRTPEAERFYAQFAGDVARCAALPPLAADAVAALVEEGSRWVEDQTRVSTVLSAVRDLAIEAGSTAARDGAATTTSVHVAQAITTRERRVSLIPDRLDELIAEGTILIDTAGAVVGQVNGLTVLSVGGHPFGKPARITARTAPGLAGIVNLERETMMSGPAHSKGILVLGGYLAGRYARDFPLSLSGTICFEQVYGEIEGDSASSAELFALLSSLADLPVRQGLAVTGSVNQQGEIQAIGGVNQKIEGFYTVCARQGLSGEQGVVIPLSNVRHLLLRPEVVAAVDTGRFHVYAIATIDEGIELLTGVPAGDADAAGTFPPGTVNARVSQTLSAFTQCMRQFAVAPALAERAIRP
jgi:predicted ATP-dependent protease